MTSPMCVDRPTGVVFRGMVIGMRVDERRAQGGNLEPQRQRGDNDRAHDVLIVGEAGHPVKDPGSSSKGAAEWALAWYRPVSHRNAKGIPMPWIVRNITWIMSISGILTASMIYAAIAPGAALSSTFGETLDGPLADVIVRNWGALIALVGGMLIYGAMQPAVRPLVLIVAGASKAVFIGLVLLHGERYMTGQAGIAVIVDAAMIILFAWYLYAARSLSPSPSPTVSV